MTLDDDETDLRRAFAALRREDEAEAPRFDSVLTAGQASRDRRRLPLLAGSAALMGVIVFVVVAVAVRRPASTPPRVAAFEQWTAPTDFLLRTPGRELLETTPRFGARPFLRPEGALADRPLQK